MGDKNINSEIIKSELNKIYESMESITDTNNPTRVMSAREVEEAFIKSKYNNTNKLLKHKEALYNLNNSINTLYQVSRDIPVFDKDFYDETEGDLLMKLKYVKDWCKNTLDIIYVLQESIEKDIQNGGFYS